jgi:hypothetical protein
MKYPTFVLIAILTSLFSQAAQEGIEYRFEQVRSKVIVVSPVQTFRAAEGAVAFGGDRVRTGWLGHAVIAVPRKAAHFEIFGSSEVVLSPEAAGVILSIDRGRLSAVFDALAGNESRAIRTPGALLAVRGTRYGVEVHRDQRAVLVVFEGLVEIISPLSPEPMMVRAGQISEFGPAHVPQIRQMHPGMTEKAWHGRGQASEPGAPGVGRGSSNGRQPSGNPPSGRRPR